MFGLAFTFRLYYANYYSVKIFFYGVPFRDLTNGDFEFLDFDFDFDLDFDLEFDFYIE